MPSKTNADVRAQVIRKASYIALIGNFILCAVKITAGVISNSLSLLSDGLDSAGDTAIAAMAVIVGFIIAKPSDKEHPWGHQRAETIASLLLVCIIIFAGFQLLISAVGRFLSIYKGNIISQPNNLILMTAGISIVGKIILSVTQYVLGKKANSTIVSATAKNMLNDIIISSSVIAGYLLCRILGTLYPDAIIAFFVSCWVIFSAIKLFIELNLELMDGTANQEIYKHLFEAIETVPQVKNPHKARIRKIAHLWDIDLDIEVDGNLSVHEAHCITEHVSDVVKEKLGNVYDIVIHVEPYNSTREHEAYGLSPQDM